MCTFSCHISFLKSCRDHDFIPRGLRLKDPIKSANSKSTLHSASLKLLKDRLNSYRRLYHQEQRHLTETYDKLKTLLDDEHFDKLLELHKKKSRSVPNTFLNKHDKKFRFLINEAHLPYTSPYQQLQSFDIHQPTVSGPLKFTSPTIKPNIKKPTVVNLSGVNLTPAETELLSLGLKFSPNECKPSTAAIASKIESATRKHDPTVENAIANDITNILSRPPSTKPNLKPHLTAALKSLQNKKRDLKTNRTDKGNATVIMTQKQYDDKMMEHLTQDCYSPLKKDPTDSLTRKLDNVLKKLLNEQKTHKSFYDSCRTSNPRRP